MIINNEFALANESAVGHAEESDSIELSLSELDLVGGGGPIAIFG